MRLSFSVYGVMLAVLAAGCRTDTPRTASVSGGLIAAAEAASPPASFSDYWHQGKAEITSYRLEQARYGEIHAGHAVLIFVTEDLSRSKQVKLDDPAAAGEDAVNVLKLNAMRNFTTGIYPYAMMASVFSPVDRARYPHPLKITMSAQEWCGQAFVQMNLRDTVYTVQQYSYFEREGDISAEVGAVMPEDGIWTAIRLDPASLPTGTVRVIPGAMFQRLNHTPWAIQTAQASLQPDAGQPDQRAYTLEYPALNRTLTIRYRSAFPYEIESWEETYPDGFGSRAKLLATKAVRMKRVMVDYWTKNHVADRGWRKALDLE
jgi:hypothetical protein